MLTILNILVLAITVIVIIAQRTKIKTLEAKLDKHVEKTNDFIKTQHVMNKEVLKRTDHIMLDHNYLSQSENF